MNGDEEVALVPIGNATSVGKSDQRITRAGHQYFETRAPQLLGEKPGDGERHILLDDPWAGANRARHAIVGATVSSIYNYQPPLSPAGSVRRRGTWTYRWQNRSGIRRRRCGRSFNDAARRRVEYPELVSRSIIV